MRWATSTPIRASSPRPSRRTSGRREAMRRHGIEHTLTLQTVNNLGNLYVDQGELVEAEQMYERALRGYEKALGADHIMIYIPALNTKWNFGSLYERQANFIKARTMYSKAVLGYGKVFGPDHPRSRSIQDKLQPLDVVTENETSKRRRRNGE
jgi:tetratricopeptide (TPR) repeat protein